MKKLAFALVMLLIPSAAMAGQIKITGGLDANVNAYTKTRAIPDADITSRVLPALKWQFGQICTPNAQNPRQQDCRDRTNQEAMDAWLNGVSNSLTAIVRRYEQNLAAQQAAQGVTDLP